MNKQAITISLVILIIAISLVYFFYQPQSNTEKKEEIIPTSWSSHYKFDSRDPYGTYLLFELLKQSTFDFKLIQGNPSDELIKCTKDSSGKLLVVCGSNYSNNEKLWNRIYEFLDAGNKALFILEEDPDQLVFFYKGIFEVKSKLDSTTTLQLAKDSNKKYVFDKLDEFKRQIVLWKYFVVNKSLRIEKDTNSIYPGAYLITGNNGLYYFISQEENEDRKPVLIETQYGKGSILIHRTPLAFTNISLLEERNVDHLEMILDEIDYNGIIYNVPPNLNITDRNGKEKKSPLQFILAAPALSWAYYIIMGCLLLFLFFNVKRRQAAIPVSPPKVNSTLEFVDALSKIYYQKHNNITIVKHKYRIFNTFIRTHYHINIIKDKTEFSRLISMKSGINGKDVEELIMMMEAYSSSKELSDDQLIALHNKLDKFYKNCK
jgi:hypothetical protein